MIKTVNIIGSGNVSHFFLHSFADRIEIKSIYCHSTEIDSSLLNRINAKVIRDLGQLPHADLNIICVKDTAIEEVVMKISSDRAVAHTSGSVSMNVLHKFSDFGVLYPLQSISKNRLQEIKEVPILIEAGSNKFEKELFDFAEKFLYKKPSIVSSEKRKKIHLSAVIANNFTNYLLYKSKNVLLDTGADFNLLKPLMTETIEKAFCIGPELSQTGPSKRNDTKVIEEQAKSIEDEEFRKLYLQFSKLIARDFNS
ncbi:MAG: DUF2520 domain-containing protein [Crocinitomicaceae bacterium]|nr:DUF2520 domain-containing protein [Crocinitomicaceae bacterium]